MTTAKPWWENSFFVNILQSEEESKGGKDFVTVISCKVKSGVDAGYNFLSCIDSVKVEYTIENNYTLTRSFFIKSPLSNKVINEDQFIENELKLYNEVIPRVEEIGQLEVAPKRYLCQLPNCLVLEDLKEAGYKTCDSVVKLDYKHAKAVLLALAKFHAASVAVKHEYPEIIKRNGEETVYSHKAKYADRFKPRILMRLYGVAKVLQGIEGYKRFGDILVDADEAFWDLIVELHRPNSKLNVLNHGDFWTNNFLFKYDDNGFLKDVKFVDYQMRCFCSPAIDLLYFFWTSANDGVRMRMYELLEMYRHTLNSSLAELGCPERLTREELKCEITKCSPLILLICLQLPVIFPDRDNPFDVSQTESSEESMTSLDFDVNPILIPFKAQYYRTALQEMCRELDFMKIFEILVKNKKHHKSLRS